MKQDLAETNRAPALVTVRDAEVEAWLEIGWVSDGPSPVAGWQRLEWGLQSVPVAPLSAILKNSNKNGSAWSKYLREVPWDEMPCFVYLIREAGSDGLTKIGVANDVRHRLKQHQSGNSRTLTVEETWRLPTREAAYDLERLIIQHFAEYCRVGREWLAIPVEPISQYIEQVIATFGIRGVERIAPERAFNAPAELLEQLAAGRAS